jgi:hypothetical protein
MKMDSYLGKDFEDNSGIFALERCCGLPIHLGVEEGVEKQGIFWGFRIELVQTSPFRDDARCPRGTNP